MDKILVRARGLCTHEASTSVANNMYPRSLLFSLSPVPIQLQGLIFIQLQFSGQLLQDCVLRIACRRIFMVKSALL